MSIMSSALKAFMGECPVGWDIPAHNLSLRATVMVVAPLLAPSTVAGVAYGTKVYLTRSDTGVQLREHELDRTRSAALS